MTANLLTTTWTPALEAELRHLLVEERASVSEVAAAMGQSYPAILGAVRRFSIPILTKRGRVPWSPERLDELRRLLVDERLSSGQAAARMGTTRNAVMGQAHRHGIPLAASNTGFADGVRPPRKSRAKRPPTPNGGDPHRHHGQANIDNPAAQRSDNAPPAPGHSPARAQAAALTPRRTDTIDRPIARSASASIMDDLGWAEGGPTSCRFITDYRNGHDAFYCGAPTELGLSWCWEHQRIVWAVHARGRAA